MLLIACPSCGVAAEETEFAPGGQAHLKRMGLESSDADFADYLFERRNPRGVHFERWRHAFGCGKWFLAARDSVTLVVYGTYPADLAHPGAEIGDRVRAAHPAWRDQI